MAASAQALAVAAVCTILDFRVRRQLLGALPTPGRCGGVDVGRGAEAGLLAHAPSKIEARLIAANIFEG